ncbi:type VII secretion protein EccB [Streptomyces sp. NPDC051569]|uniref:type VII secretion protein EccB n=1 Tax=Streptomyces sp. NPDC051569 TaxID=3365661 RepID=UPI0037A6ECAF
MATRKDELSAYSFARKRTVAAFLAPSPGGSDEGAPRPLRTIMPSMVVGVVLVVGCIGWGVIKPTAPKGWDKPGEYIVVDSDSTTRYVVVPDLAADGKKVPTLHPVLNYASAKLLLDKDKGKVIEVPGDEIDKSGLPHGATLGIPYAPDRLPDADDAEKAKAWAVCERPASGPGTSVDRGVFVLDAADAKAVTGKGALSPREVLYVADSATGSEYLVDGEGTRFPVGDPEHGDQTGMEQLRTAVMGISPKPQKVSKEWLATLNSGGTIAFPEVPDLGRPTEVAGMPDEAGTVGRVLKAQAAQGTQYYVVLKDRIATVSPFVAELLKGSPDAKQAYPDAEIADIRVNSQDVIAANGGQAPGFYQDKGWPEQFPRQANRAVGKAGEGRTTSCSVYKGSVGSDGKPQLATWAGTAYPKSVIADSLNAFVSSGSGLLFSEVSGAAAGGGATYLLTDTGLRYSLPVNNDTSAEGNAAAVTGDGESAEASETDKARTRLGYEKVAHIAVVPATWAEFIPKGPTLDTGSASQPQSQ